MFYFRIVLCGVEKKYGFQSTISRKMFGREKLERQKYISKWEAFLRLD
jgi:hypothetical protein